MTFANIIRCALVAITTLVIGCGQSGPKLIKVEGKVWMGDKPLSSPIGSVMFHPDESKGNKSKERPIGHIDPQGNYKLTSQTREGAEPGWYKVAVTAGDAINPNDPYINKPLVPLKYINPATSGISLQVVEKPAPGAYDIKLEK